VAGRVRSVEKSSDIVNRTRHLSACSIEPQLTMVPLVFMLIFCDFLNDTNNMNISEAVLLTLLR
jgi:hypothetical protein